MRPWHEFKGAADACRAALQGSEDLDALACGLLFPPGSPIRPLSRSLDALREATREILPGWWYGSAYDAETFHASVNNGKPMYEGFGSRPNPEFRQHLASAFTEELAACAALMLAVGDLDAPYRTNPDENLYRVDLRVRLAYQETAPNVSHIVYFSSCHPGAVTGCELDLIGCPVVETAFVEFGRDFAQGKARPEKIDGPAEVPGDHHPYMLLGAPPEGTMTVGQWLDRRYLPL